MATIDSLAGTDSISDCLDSVYDDLVELNAEVQALTAGNVAWTYVDKTASYTIVASTDTYGTKVFTNDGATATITLSLPAGATAMRVSFNVVDAYTLKISANGTETIRHKATQTAGGGYLQSATAGDFITLEWNGDEWIVVTIQGHNWTDGTATLNIATTTLRGEVELATDAEAVTGTDAARALTPASGKASAIQHAIRALPGLCIRSKFRWKDADEIYIGAGEYHHEGTVEQTVYWDSELTFAAGSGGSNAASVDLAASDWYYLYIDDSAVVTLGTNLLTAAQFVMNITAPTYSAAKHGWYNGLDRCIFADLTTGANALIEFFNDGDTVLWADGATNQTAIDIDTTFTDIGALIIPAFAILGICTFSNAEGIIWSWRTNGQTGAVGHLAVCSAAAVSGRESTNVITDSLQIIEVKSNVSGAETISCTTDGWKFPTGM